MCKAATKDTLLLQLGSRTAATFTSHATGKKGQHIVENLPRWTWMTIVKMWKTKYRSATTEAQMVIKRNNNDREKEFDHMENASGREETINAAAAL